MVKGATIVARGEAHRAYPVRQAHPLMTHLFMIQTQYVIMDASAQTGGRTNERGSRGLAGHMELPGGNTCDHQHPFS